MENAALSGRFRDMTEGRVFLPAASIGPVANRIPGRPCSGRDERRGGQTDLHRQCHGSFSRLA
jgi:hypothetical protein